MTFPEINKNHIDQLIHSAEDKINSFQDKIVRIKERLVLLNQDRDSLKLIIEHIELSETREDLLIGGFIWPNEYGQKPENNDELIAIFTKKLSELESSINSYTEQENKRNKGLDFLKSDIERFNKIKSIEFQNKRYEYGVIDM